MRCDFFVWISVSILDSLLSVLKLFGIMIIVFEFFMNVILCVKKWWKCSEMF